MTSPSNKNHYATSGRLRIKLIIFFFLFFALSACHTIQTNVAADAENKEKKIRAARINSQLAIAYLERHDIERAKQKLVLAMDEAPNLPEIWYSMAYFLEATGNKEKAQQHYLQAIKLAPKRGDSQNNYGTFLCRAGHYQEAIQHFLIAVQDPTYLDPAAAYENAGMCALKIPDPVRATHYLNKALLENPNRPTSLISLAQLNYQTKDYAAAKKALDRFHKVSSPTDQSMALMEKIYAHL